MISVCVRRFTDIGLLKYSTKELFDSMLVFITDNSDVSKFIPEILFAPFGVPP